MALKYLPFISLICTTALAPSLYPAKPNNKKPKPEHRWNQTQLGPVFSASLKSSGDGLKFEQSPKTIAIRVGDDGNAGVGFDTDMLRMVAGWTGGFVRINPGRNALLDHHSARGVAHFNTSSSPGWTHNGEWYNHKKQDGPIPADKGRYTGLYLHGDRVVLSYGIAGKPVLESSWLAQVSGNFVFTRTFEVSEDLANEMVYLADAKDPKAKIRKVGRVTMLTANLPGDKVLAIAAIGDAGVQMTPQGRAVAKIIKGNGTRRFTTYIWTGSKSQIQAISNLIQSHPDAPSLETWTKGGSARWPETLETQGVLGKNKGAYTVDTLTPPFDNPWKAILHFGGHDFLPNGDAAICTMEGDVWLVKGINADLKKLTWQRIATGLYHPLGLRVVDGQVYVLGRDQITRLHDLNGDGEADFYENFSNLGKVSRGGHEYVTCLETDPDGNFYYIKCANGTDHGGSILKVSKDGRNIERVATGFRNPNGFFVSNKSGIITAADQQGTWVPSSRVDIVKPGGFYGFVPMHHRSQVPDSYDPPVTWIPHKVDNSSGGQVWVEGGKWGALEGELLHLSYGRCEMFLVLRDEFGDIIQGGVAKFPFRFNSGAMRARFNSRDGQLYVSGLQGWQTSGAKDGCFQRVRYTGKPILLPVGLQVHEDGILLEFHQELDQELAEDPGSYSVKQWNYRWTKAYGSNHYKPSAPDQIGEDPVPVLSARLQQGGKSVFIKTAKLQQVMQMEIAYDLESLDGDEMIGKVHNTIHQTRPARN